jgi:hypothetical protein
MRLSTLTTALNYLSFASAALPALHIKGSKFFDANGGQFYVKGACDQAFVLRLGPGGAWFLYMLVLLERQYETDVVEHC